MNFFKMIFGSRSKNCGNLSYYKSLIGFTPRHVEYYDAAFTHKSVNEHDSEGHKVNNERLEFLGDAVLGVVIALYSRSTRQRRLSYTDACQNREPRTTQYDRSQSSF